MIFFRVNLNISVQRKRCDTHNSSSVCLSIYLSFSSIYLFIHDLYLSGCSLIRSTELYLVISWNFSQCHPDEFIHTLSFQTFLKVFPFFFHCFNSTYIKITHSQIYGICLKTSLLLYFMVYDNSKLLGM